MKVETFQTVYAKRVQCEMFREVNSVLSLNISENETADVLIRPLLVDGCFTYNRESKKYKIYLRHPNPFSDKSKRSDHTLSDSEQANLELALYHETGHIVHNRANSRLWNEWLLMRDSLDKSKDKKRTLNYERNLHHSEMAAEGLAWWYINRKQGISDF